MRMCLLWRLCLFTTLSEAAPPPLAMFSLTAMTRKLRSGGVSDPEAPSAKKLNQTDGMETQGLEEDLLADAWADSAPPRPADGQQTAHLFGRAPDTSGVSAQMRAENEADSDQLHPIAGVNVAGGPAAKGGKGRGKKGKNKDDTPSAATAQAAADIAKGGDPVTKSAAQRGRRSQGSRQDDDFSKDWMLSDKDLDNKSLKLLVAMLGQLGLTHALQIKVLRSIAVDVTVIPSTLEFIATSKAYTSEYAQASSALPAEKRKLLPAPYVLVWNRIVEWARAKLNVDAAKNEDALTAFSEYLRQLQHLDDDHAKAFAVAKTVRYCRIRTTYVPDRRIVEVATNLEGGADTI
jgi:hypothetical protein